MSKNNKTVAIILCGGEGSRLGRVGRKINKTLIKYKKKVLLEHIFEKLLKYKIYVVFLPVGYKHLSIKKLVKKNIFIKSKFKKMKITTNFTGFRTEIHQRIKQTIGQIPPDTSNIILINGDSYYDFNFKSILKFHNQKKAYLTLVSCNKNIDYGLLKSQDQKMISFNRNIKIKNFCSNDKNKFSFYSGLCIISYAFLKHKIKKIKKNFEKEFFEAAIKSKKSYNFFTNKKFFDINTEIDLLHLEK